MSMEHRGGGRRAVSADVILDCRPAGLLRGRVKDISIGGMFVKLPTIPRMSNRRVRVIFVRRQHRVSRIYRVHAAVTRRGQDGAGLMFNDLNPNAFYALLAILLADEERARRRIKYGVPPRSEPENKRSILGSWFNKTDR